MKKSSIASSIAASILAMSSFGVFADSGSGVVNFSGSVITAPCNIEADTATQDIDLGQVSASVLDADQTSTPQLVELNLTGCDNTTMTEALITFNGTTVAGDSTGTELVATNPSVAVKMQDPNGLPVVFGTAVAPLPLASGTNTYQFNAALVKATGIVNVTEGEFTAVTNFAIAYQ